MIDASAITPPLNNSRRLPLTLNRDMSCKWPSAGLRMFLMVKQASCRRRAFASGFTGRFMAAVALVLIVLNDGVGIPMAQANQDQLAPGVLYVICEEPSSGMCRALAAALSQEHRQVEVVPQTTGLPTIAFVEEIRTSTSLSGHLAWRATNGVEGRGPTLRFQVTDATLSERMLRDYVNALLHESPAAR